jgi:superfamily II DNA or RNA helicase
MSSEEKNRYDRVIVEDPYRSDAIGRFVKSVVRKERAFEGIVHGAPGIVFCRLQAHAERLATAISWELERPVPVVTSRMRKNHRDDLVDRMKARDPELPVVVACMVWSTGIDIPPLEWTLWAGEGQAPIWLKQAGGRGTRLEPDKLGFVIFDWQTVGPETEVYQEQAAKRQQHYQDGGFMAKPTPRASPGSKDTDAEVQLLDQLLSKPPESKLAPLPKTTTTSSRQVRFIYEEEPTPNTPEDNPFYPYNIDKRYLKDPWFWFWPLLWKLGIPIVCIILFYYLIQWVGSACNM